jgi:CRP-like cAMP-binding protein/thioredoxin reductase/Fe-S-cluster-containing hydrogenase component 2
MSERVRIAIIGAGPGGLSAAAHAADLGVSHVLLEASAHAADTIFKYQKRKHVMAEPSVLPLRSPLPFAAGTREQVLEGWEQTLKKLGVQLQLRSPVKEVRGAAGSFEIAVAGGATVAAEAIVLAIGLQGNLRKLGVPGEDLPFVQYQLDDPDEYDGETIIVVGAGDAAIENALALANANRVILINRNDEFARCKDGNLKAVLAAIEAGQIECRYGTSPASVEQVDGARGRFNAKTPQGLEAIACNRVIARLGAIPPRKMVESFGIAFPSNDPAAVPQLSATYESSVPGIYVVGALGGYPLIKQAINQGYEVVETILGRTVEPADEPLLRSKFAHFSAAREVGEALALVQRNVPLLASLTTLQLREFMLDSEVRTPRAGDLIFRRNDYSSSFYSIVDGSVEVEVPVGERAGQWVTLGRGQFFGELGLISGRRRAATVKAGPNCVLIETPRRPMLKLIASVTAVRQLLDKEALKRALRAYLSQDLADADLERLAASAQVKSWSAGEPLFVEGAEADGLYLIRRGSAMVARTIGGREVVLAYVAAGNIVGEMALLTDAPRMATVRAAVTTEAIVLDAAAFKDTVARNPALRGKLQQLVMARMRTNVAMESDAESGNLVSFLMQQGVGEATDVLLIDESLCIRCNHCEKACADTHGGTSRLNREAGPTFASVHVPTSCRHCEHPHCMKDCPPDAIHRSPAGEVFIADTCIGCGNCVRNCPYGVIQLAPVSSRRGGGSLLLWLLGIGREPGAERPHKDANAPKRAVKCDMCRELAGGPACVRACPTGAALRVSPEKFLDYTALARR